MILRESNNPVMSEQNLFTDFNENFGFDNSLSQTGINGYLQNEKAIEYFKNKLTEWNRGVIRIRVQQCHETLKVLYGNIFSHQAFFSKGD
jgi:hypothetical protein